MHVAAALIRLSMAQETRELLEMDRESGMYRKGKQERRCDGVNCDADVLRFCRLAV